MGILNVTDDSFYDGGRYRTVDIALARVETMVEEGADLIDVGGEKAGPGTPVSATEEIERVAPVIEAIRRRWPVHVSVDTFKSEVARAAVEVGAGMINSISGFGDSALRQVAVQSGAAVVIMHIQGRPRVHQPDPQYSEVTQEVAQWLVARTEECVAAGINPKAIVIDPGPGFGKTAGHDLDLVGNIGRLTVLPYPVLLAASRKPFIGALLDATVDNRLEGSLAVAAWGVLHGVKLVRTHDVRATARVVRMVEAVLGARWPAEESA